MASGTVKPRLRRTWFGLGGYRRDDVDALQAELAQRKDENSELTSALQSARLALGESAGWSERLPEGLNVLASLAAGELDEEPEGRLGTAILAVAGDHLLAQVEVSLGEPEGELERNTSWNENGRPVRTLVALGGCVVDCAWQPGVDAGPDTARVIEGLCSAVVCSLVGVVASRVDRDVVTQLGDERACARHQALRARLQQPTASVLVAVEEKSVVSFGQLFGRVAWDAALSSVAAALDRVAHNHGGQAYQVFGLGFRLLVDEDALDTVMLEVEQELVDYDGLIFRVGDA